jgi:hypothetical protein
LCAKTSQNTPSKGIETPNEQYRIPALSNAQAAANNDNNGSKLDFETKPPTQSSSGDSIESSINDDDSWHAQTQQHSLSQFFTA